MRYEIASFPLPLYACNRTECQTAAAASVAGIVGAKIVQALGNRLMPEAFGPG
jgi:hypothetical protein